MKLVRLVSLVFLVIVSAALLLAVGLLGVWVDSNYDVSSVVEPLQSAFGPAGLACFCSVCLVLLVAVVDLTRGAMRRSLEMEWWGGWDADRRGAGIRPTYEGAAPQAEQPDDEEDESPPAPPSAVGWVADPSVPTGYRFTGLPLSGWGR